MSEKLAAVKADGLTVTQKRLRVPTGAAAEIQDAAACGEMLQEAGADGFHVHAGRGVGEGIRVISIIFECVCCFVHRNYHHFGS